MLAGRLIASLAGAGEIGPVRAAVVLYRVVGARRADGRYRVGIVLAVVVAHHLRGPRPIKGAGVAVNDPGSASQRGGFRANRGNPRGKGTCLEAHLRGHFGLSGLELLGGGDALEDAQAARGAEHLMDGKPAAVVVAILLAHDGQGGHWGASIRRDRERRGEGAGGGYGGG